MNIEYAPEVRQSAEWPLIRQASDLLPTVLDAEGARTVSATWSRVQQPTGGLAYRLSLTDSVGQASMDFTPDQLRNTLYMRVRTSEVWSDLLQIHIDQQHERVQVAIADMLAGSGVD